MGRGNLVRTHMLRAMVVVLMAVGAFLYPIVQWSDSTSLSSRAWPISFAFFHAAVLSSEVMSPAQERPSTAIAYSPSAHQISASNATETTLAVDLKIRTQEGEKKADARRGSGPSVLAHGDHGRNSADQQISAAEENITESHVDGGYAHPEQIEGFREEQISLHEILAGEKAAGAHNLPSSTPVVVIKAEEEEKKDSETSAGANAQEKPLISEIVELEVHSVQEVASSAVAVKKPEWRRLAEDQLAAAKLAIHNSSWQVERDEVLHEPVFQDVSLFKKSYEQMEKTFKIFAYKEGEKPLVHTGPLTGIYSSEGQFMDTVSRGSRFVTKDPNKAHMFFLPYSVAQMVEKLYVPDSHSMLPLATFIKEYVYELAGKYPYWNLTAGRDHFFVACHDWGPATARDHPDLRQNAVKVVCNADLTEQFVVEKDVSLLEVYLHKPRRPKKGKPRMEYSDIQLGGNLASHRPYLAFFAGQMHGRVRPVLLQHWQDKDPDMKIYGVLPRAIAKQLSYTGHMKSSKFCICAMGYEVNSPRLVESIYYECVPVIIADNFVLPFSDVLDWSAFSITVAEKDIPDLKDILLQISDSQYGLLHGRLRYVRQHFLWHPKNPQKYDAFHMILHSLWMSRLKQIHTQ